MPFTADLHGEVLDATCVTGERWATVHRVRPRAPLRCRGCGDGMQAKVSKAGQRFFAHDSKSPACPSAGETVAHLRLKALIAHEAREVGLLADLEVASEPGAPGGAWRADVLVSDVERIRQVAFEVQLAAMTATEGAERTVKYEADGVEAVWVGTKSTPWLCRIPSVRIDPDTALLDVGVARITEMTAAWTRWEHVPVDLARFMRALFAGRLVATEVETVTVPSRSAYGDHVRPAWVFTKPELARAGDEAREQARRQAERAERAFQRHQAEHDKLLANTAALHDRQQRVTEALIAELTTESDPPPFLVIGDGRSQPPPVDWAKIERKALSANGIPVRVVDRSGHPQLVAVVCPVAARISPKMAGFWAHNDVAVVVSDGTEADRVATALGRKASTLIRVLRPDAPAAE